MNYQPIENASEAQLEALQAAHKAHAQGQASLELPNGATIALPAARWSECCLQILETIQNHITH